MSSAATTILFDLDGTLTDNFEGIANCIRYALARMDLPDPGTDALRACVGPPLRETLPRLIGSDDATTTERALALSNQTTDGVVYAPSAFGTTAGRPDSST